MFKVALFLYQTDLTLACWGSSGTPEDPPKGMLMLDPNNPKHFNNWSPPPGVSETWLNWLNYYKEANEGRGQYKDPNLPGKPYGHNVPGFPSSWGDLGNPLRGVAPPPWAYVPRNVGKPTFCYQPPEYGTCSGSFDRYGYNPYTDECKTFPYSGCGGNRNNYQSQLSCERDCMSPPVDGCSVDSQIPVDYIIAS